MSFLDQSIYLRFKKDKSYVTAGFIQRTLKQIHTYIAAHEFVCRYRFADCECK